jgi:hypothetical protein
MKVNFKSIVFSALMLSATALTANTMSTTNVDQIKPLEAHITHLEDYTAVVYYTVLPNGDYEVITTTAPNENVAGLSTQHRMTISIDQSYTLVLDQGPASSGVSATTITAMPDVLRIARN